MSQPATSVRCPHCGTMNRAIARVCANCGKPLEPGRVTRELDSRATQRVLVQPAAQETTQPLPAAPGGAATTRRLPPPAFDFMPEGAVFNRRYESKRTLKASQQYNEYRVWDPQTERHLILRELPSANGFNGVRQLVERRLRHPALLTIEDAFTWAPYAHQERCYLVTEEAERLETAGVKPISEVQLLTWGAQLAGALAYLHQQRLAHRHIQESSLYVVNKQAKLGDFSNLGNGTLDAQVADVHQLAQTLYQLGLAPGQTALSFSDKTMRVLQRALSPIPAQRYALASELGADLQQALEARRRPESVTLTVGRLTDVGKRRELNEDALKILEADQMSQSAGRALGLYVVSDGMGGAAAGEVASKMVTEKLVQTLGQQVYGVEAAGEPDYGGLLKAAGEATNRAVYEARQKMHNDMGATLVAALMVGNQAYIINVGDSRAYLIGQDRIERITKDHSLVQLLVDGKQIKPEEVYTHPQRNVIMRNIGDKPDIEIDLFTVLVEPGQAILLCSDGLWELVRDPDIQKLVVNAKTPQDACEELIAAANHNGGDDNITALVIKVDETTRSSK